MSQVQTNTPRRIGIIAGCGLYPLTVAKLLREKNYSVYCAAIRDCALPEIAQYCVKYQPIGLGQFGKAIRFFKKHNVYAVAMAGGIKKQLLFSPKFIWKHFPDFYTAKFFAQHVLFSQKSQTNDSLLLRCVEAFETQGIHIVSATDFVPELIMKQAILTKRRPSAHEWKNIQYGWRIAREIGRLDIGQSVAVKNQSIIAVEALEGTDGCINRAGRLCPSGGFSLIKIGKPNQDMRFDVPFFGMETLKNLIGAGARVLVMEAGRTIVVEAWKCADFADRNNMCIIIIDEKTVQMPELPANLSAYSNTP